MNELKILNKYEQQENQFYQEGKTYDGGGYDNTCVYAQLEYNGHEYAYKELDYNAGCFRDDYSLYIEDYNKNLLFNYHYYMDQDRDEFHFFINKDVIDENFFKQLQENKLLRNDIEYNNVLDFNFKKDFANKNLDKTETDILEVMFMSRDDNAFVDYVFKFNNNVYYICYDVNFTTNTKTILIKKYNVNEDSDNKILSLTFKNNSTIVDEYDENEISISLLMKLEKEFSLDLNIHSFLSAKRINKYLVKDEIKIAKFCYDGVILTIHSRFINLSESEFVHEVSIIGENKKEIFTYRKKFGTIFDEPIYYFNENVVTEDFIKLLYADNKTKDVLTKCFSLYDVDYKTMLERNRNTILKKKS